MARDVEEWVGANDNTPVPDRVRLRVLAKADHRCTICTRKLRPGEKWTCEHVIALINWLATVLQPHGNRESNLGVTCCNCLPVKNAADVAEKSDVAEKAKKHWLPKGPSRSFRKPAGYVHRWGTSTDAAAARDTAARMAYSLEHQVDMLRSNLNRTFAPEVANAAIAEILSNMAKDMGARL